MRFGGDVCLFVFLLICHISNEIGLFCHIKVVRILQICIFFSSVESSMEFYLYQKSSNANDDVGEDSEMMMIMLLLLLWLRLVVLIRPLCTVVLPKLVVTMKFSWDYV